MSAFHLHAHQQTRKSLTAKAMLMTHFQPQRTLGSLIRNRTLSATTAQSRIDQAALMNAWNAEVNEDLLDQLTMTVIPMSQLILVLKAAPLKKKRDVLSTMPIINDHSAAMFLGITQPAFNHFISFHRYIFGAHYMGKRCFSADELMLIAANPEWTSTTPATARKATHLDHTHFDYGTVVEEKVAMALGNLTRSELPKIAYVTSSDIRTYSLADLENIRIAKLSALQQ